MEVTKSDYAFWSTLEADLNLKIPCHIKNAFHLCGFSNALSFKNINSDDINYVQQYICNDLDKILQDKARQTNQIHDQSKNQHFFGSYTSNPAAFTLNRGEIKLIAELVLHVKEIVDANGTNTGLAHFQMNKCVLKGKITALPSLILTSYGFFFGERSNNDDVAGSNNIKHSSVDRLKQKLFKSATNLMNSFGNVKQKRSELCENMINVNIDDQNKVTATVSCIFCDANVKVSCLKADTSAYWVLSNLKVHINKKHLTKKEGDNKTKGENQTNTKSKMKSKTTKTSNEIEEADMEAAQNSLLEKDQGLATVNPSDTNGLLMAEKIEAVIDLDATTDDEEAVSNENSGSASGSNTTIALQIEPYIASSQDPTLNDEFDHYEDLIYRQMSTQIIKMINTTMKNQESISKVLLNFDVANMSSIATVNVCEIKPDGSCLFGALSHQLFYVKLNSTEHDNHGKQSRQSVVRHINENQLEYFNVVKSRVHEKKQGKKIEDMESECYDFVNRQLPQLTCWGGTESLKALSNIHNVNIVTIHEDGSCSLADDFNPNYERTVMILYRNQNHYDSIIEISEESIVNYAKEIVSMAKRRRMFLNDIKNSMVILMD